MLLHSPDEGFKNSTTEKPTRETDRWMGLSGSNVHRYSIHTKKLVYREREVLAAARHPRTDLNPLLQTRLKSIKTERTNESQQREQQQPQNRAYENQILSTKRGNKSNDTTGEERTRCGKKRGSR